jgi:hypothetical protein
MKCYNCNKIAMSMYAMGPEGHQLLLCSDCLNMEIQMNERQINYLTTKISRANTYNPTRRRNFE